MTSVNKALNSATAANSILRNTYDYKRVIEFDEEDDFEGNSAANVGGRGGLYSPIN